MILLSRLEIEQRGRALLGAKASLPAPQGTWKNNLFIPKVLSTSLERTPSELGLSVGPKLMRTFEFDVKHPDVIVPVRAVYMKGKHVCIMDIRLLETPKVHASFNEMYCMLYRNTKENNMPMLFCDSQGVIIVSNLNEQLYAYIHQVMYYFSTNNTFFVPKSDYLLVILHKNNEVVIKDIPGPYPNNEYDDIVCSPSVEAFVVYDKDGHLCQAWMTQESAEVIKKYIEDNEDHKFGSSMSSPHTPQQWGLFCDVHN